LRRESSQTIAATGDVRDSTKNVLTKGYALASCMAEPRRGDNIISTPIDNMVNPPRHPTTVPVWRRTRRQRSLPILRRTHARDHTPHAGMPMGGPWPPLVGSTTDSVGVGHGDIDHDSSLGVQGTGGNTYTTTKHPKALAHSPMFRVGGNLGSIQGPPAEVTMIPNKEDT
jgi:hypothetical protein